MSRTAIQLADQALRAPHSLLSDDPEDLSRDGPTLAVLTAAGAAIFGMSAGSWHGGVQLVFAAVKAPLLFMIPLAVCLPAMRVLLETEGQELSHTKVALAGLVGMARAGMLSAALSPVLWLFLSLHPSYASAALWLAGTLALAGLPGLVTIARILAPPRRRLPAVLVSVLLLGATTAQTGWLLRPFIALPHAEVTFLRPLEHDIAHALFHNLSVEPRREHPQ